MHWTSRNFLQILTSHKLFVGPRSMSSRSIPVNTAHAALIAVPYGIHVVLREQGGCTGARVTTQDELVCGRTRIPTIKRLVEACDGVDRRRVVCTDGALEPKAPQAK